MLDEGLFDPHSTLRFLVVRYIHACGGVCFGQVVRSFFFHSGEALPRIDCFFPKTEAAEQFLAVLGVEHKPVLKEKRKFGMNLPKTSPAYLKIRTVLRSRIDFPGLMPKRTIRSILTTKGQLSGSLRDSMRPPGMAARFLVRNNSAVGELQFPVCSGGVIRFVGDHQHCHFHFAIDLFDDS